ncbi:MAG TPA: hypothetical protein VML96_01780, partial [Egibacteraceae bacterium]|nr:hypothetical protein [Egibacteraceae bacterium]
EGLALGRGVVIGVALAVSLLTLFSMTKIWAGAFWGPPEGGHPPATAAAPDVVRVQAGGSGVEPPPGGAPRGQRGEPAAAAPAVTARLRPPRLMTAATGGLVMLSLAIALAAGPVYELSERAAADLVDPGPYIEAVLGS